MALLLTALGCARASDTRLALDGRWEARPGSVGEDYAAATSTGQGWMPATIPSRIWPSDALNNAAVVWVRRTVVLPADLAGHDAVLHWGRIRWGAKAWVNGVAVGESPVTCPHDVVLPAGLVRPGENRVVLRVGGWASVPKRKGVPLIPAGFPNFGRPHPGGIFGDVWLDFYRRAHISHVLMMPDVADSKVRVRVWVDGARALSGEATLSARANPWQPGGAARQVLGTSEARIDLGDSPGPFDLDVPLRGAKLWSPASPNLCLAHIELRAGGQLCHAVDVRFGQRQFRIVDGHYELNGKRFFMRGENLMWQWFWSDRWYSDDAMIEHYLVDFERGMNSKGFRTHTSPPERRWLDIADEKGMLFLSEFPMTMNYAKWPFSPEDWKVYEHNALLEAEGWVREQCNRPSVIIWVPTNEFPSQAAWQNTTLYKTIKALDPTRPILRASEATPDIVDIHCYSGYWGGAEGDFYNIINQRAKNRDPKRPLGCSEYIENWNPERQVRWNGRRGTDLQAMLVYSQFISEQTEAMRRLQYDLILPYGASGRSADADMTTPNYQALRSALAPVAVSIDLFDRNFVAGRDVPADVCFINDTPEPQRVAVECYITRESPEFLLNPDFARAPLFKQSLSAEVPASSVVRRPVRWPLPAQEGKYYLSAVLTAGTAKPVVSQRIVRSLAPEERAAANTPVLVLGGDAELVAWLKLRGLPFVRPGDAGADQASRVLVWNAAHVTAQQRALAPDILRRVRAGGRLVIVAQGKWDWPGLADFSLGKARSSRAFWSSGVRVPKGLNGEYLRRWNGFAGAVADSSIQGPVAGSARTLVWVAKPGTSVLTDVTEGAGHLLLTTLRFRGRLNPQEPTYDPAAERMLVYLLGE